MPIAVPTLHYNNGTAGTSRQSTSFTPTANSLLMVHGWARINAGATSAAFSIDNTGGLSFTLEEENPVASGSSPSGRVAVWSCAIGSSPSAMTVTITQTEAVQVILQIFDVLGAESSITNIGVDDSNVGDPSASISAPSAGSMVVAAAGFCGGESPATPLATQLAEKIQTGGNNAVLETSYTLENGPSSAAWTTASNTRSAVILYEIKVGPITGVGAGTLLLTGAGSADHGVVADGAGTLILLGAGIASLDFSADGAGVLSFLVGSGDAQHGIGPAVGAGTMPSIEGVGIFTYTPPPPPDTLTLVIWSRCDRCGLRTKPDQLVREVETGLWLHSYCLDEGRSTRRPGGRRIMFRNPRPDTDLENDR